MTGTTRGRPLAPNLRLPNTALDQLALTGGCGGVVLGADERGAPVQVQLLRATATRVVLVGGLYPARQLALRAAATGVWTVIATGRPQAWAPVVRAGGTSEGGIEVRGLPPGALIRPRAQRPLLLVQDGGVVPQQDYPAATPWQCTLSVLPDLHMQAGPAVADADLALVQRLPAAQAELAVRVWRVRPEVASTLTRLRDDELLALSGDGCIVVRVVTTPRESALLGPVRRGD